MAWLLIKDNIIINHIAYDGVSEYTPPDGMTLVNYESNYDLGWFWNDGNPTAPEPPPAPPQPTQVGAQDL